jgi:parallel beta-helix repeat protein
MADKTYLKSALTISLLFVVLTFSTSTHAKIIYVDDDATGNNDGSSWADSFNFLQDALAAAWSSDEIRVAQGIYTPDSNSANPNGSGDRYATFQLINGVTLQGGYAGFGKPDPDALDVDLYETILSGDLDGNDVEVNDPFDLLTEPTRGENSYHVVTGSETDETTILDGFTITAGNADGPYPYGYRGGGMFSESGSLTLTNCTFSGNSAFDGGGMHNLTYSNHSKPRLSNCTFSENAASGTGGGIFNSKGSPELFNCLFSGNASEKNGGGMSSRYSSPILSYCTFAGNSAQTGGGMYSTDGTPQLTNCTFSDNSAWDGGGIRIGSSRGATLTRCDFTANSATSKGGGIRYSGRGMTLTDCTFRGNFAGDVGGGVDYSGYISSMHVLTNCTFTSNSTSKNGGGMYIYSSNPTLTNCTFAQNSADDSGGGMYNRYSSPIIENCVFNDNSANKGGGIYHYGYCESTLTGCIIRGNRAENDGGGIYNDNKSSPLMSNCIFSRNSGGRYGGGICNWYYNSSTLNNCSFNTNVATYGGGILNYLGSSPVISRCRFSGNSATKEGGGISNATRSSPTMANCIFLGNVAVDAGGAIHNWDQSNAALTNCTFSANAADKGGVVYNKNESDVIVSNCIMWDNAATQGSSIYLALYTYRDETYTSSIVLNYSDIQGGQVEIHIDPNCKLIWLQGNIDADPCFVEPGYWEDPCNTPDTPWDDVWVDGDYNLLLGSPCIDTGDPNYIAGPNETDLDGRPRVIGGRIDMGAYESPIPAEARILPRTINLASKGKWITCYIWLSDHYDVADIVPGSVMLERQIKAEQFSVDEHKQVAAATFDRKKVQSILNVGDIELKISCQLTDGTYFEATDIVQVTDKAGKN